MSKTGVSATPGTAHWVPVRLRYLGHLKGGAGFPDGEQGKQGEEFPFFKVKHLAESDADGCLRFSEHTVSRDTAAQLGAFVFPTGTIVFAKVGAALLLNRFRFIGQASCIDNNMMGLVLDSSRADKRFMLHSMAIVDFGQVANPGAVPSLNAEQVAEQVVLLPPLPAQLAIADYLDGETARLDTLVAAKERVLGLLAEKRRALITRAVTRGLAPHAPLRDSGIPWLGEIPAHWNVMKLKHIASLNSGEFITADSIDSDGDFPVFGGNGMRGYTSSFTHDGDYVLIGRQGALCGNINYATGRFWASEHAVVVSLREGYQVRWLGELLEVLNLNQFSQSAAQPGLAVEVIANLALPIPPFSEQRAIADRITSETAKIDALRSETGRTIALLKERRAALIAVAVTGQLEVA